MFIEDVLKKCEDEGCKITRSGLYATGKRIGFIRKIEGVKSLEFDKKLFLEWIEKKKETPPEGWISVKQISEKYNVSLPQAYLLIKDEDCEIVTVGPGRGIKYVDPERIEKIIQKHRNRNKIDWGE